MTGYAVSFVAVALHIGDLVTSAPRFHYAASSGHDRVRRADHDLRGAGGHSGPKMAAGRDWQARWCCSFLRFRLFTSNRRMILKHGPERPRCTTREFRLRFSFYCRTTGFFFLDAFIRFLVSADSRGTGSMGGIPGRGEVRASLTLPGGPFLRRADLHGACLALSLFAYIRSRGSAF